MADLPARLSRRLVRAQAGTSFSSPIMAGIQALVNQRVGARQGNPNPVYYQIAATEYGAAGSNSCNSSNGVSAGNSCVFYDVTLGDMDVNCTGNQQCYLASGAVGVLATSNSSFAPAYGTTTGWGLRDWNWDHQRHELGK